MARRLDAAMQKFQNGLTENQQKLVRDELLRRAIEEAETKIHATTKYRIMPHYRLQVDTPTRALQSAVFWSHVKLRHLWEVDDEGRTVSVDYSRL